MKFMNAYKKLDKLCRDQLGADTGVSAYIEAMDEIGMKSAYSGQAEDYRKLKHYRHIRNQIAHEDWANEEDMCTDGDVRWLENFYQRIIDQKDPLAQRRRVCESGVRPTQGRGERTTKKKTVDNSSGTPKQGASVAYGLLIVVIITVVLCAVTFLVSRLAI